MKKILSLLLVFLLLLSGCGNNSEDASSDPVSGDTAVSDNSEAPDGSVETDTNKAPTDKNTTTKVNKKTTTKSSEKTTTTANPFLDPSIFGPEGNDVDIEAELAAKAKRKPWKQEKFYLSTFRVAAGGRSDDVYRKGLKAVQEAGINLIEHAIMNGASVYQSAKICEELGLDFLVNDIARFTGMGNEAPSGAAASLAKNVVEDYCGFDHMVGYFLWDEPSEENFKTLRERQDAFQKLDPGSLVYSLLLPSYGRYAWDPNSVTDSVYKNYVDNFISVCDPPVLSFDYYPIRGEVATLAKNDLWRDLGYFRKRSIETNKPLWFYFQAVAMVEGYDPTDAAFKAQMYAALAYGTKGLSYFNAQGSLVDDNGNKTSRYNSLKAINQTVIKLGDFLFDKKQGGLYHTGLTDQQVSLYSLNKNSESACPFTQAPDELIISVFSDSNAKYLVVVNKNLKKAISGTMTLKSSHKVSTMTLSSGKFGSASSTNAISLNIPAGDCKVFKLA